ncbi:MAG: MarR family transcriptional regulator [Lachnospiraceae bacterium]|nr:MarR family transcriptional regulator [Lachnospiraceae bacterium]
MDKERPLCFEFKKMHHIVIRAIHDRLASCGFDEVTVLHGHILGYLYYNSDRDIYPRDIVKEYEIGKSSVTNVLQLMEEKGYLTRTTDERDGRLKKIRLTKKGEEVHRQTIEVIDRLHRDMESGITEQEREIFFRIVDKMRENAVRQHISEDMQN